MKPDLYKPLRAQLDRIEATGNRIENEIGNALITPQEEQGRDMDIDAAYIVALAIFSGEVPPQEGAKKILNLLRPYAATNTKNTKPW
jgi:hypothetical protein